MEQPTYKDILNLRNRNESVPSRQSYQELTSKLEKVRETRLETIVEKKILVLRDRLNGVTLELGELEDEMILLSARGRLMKERPTNSCLKNTSAHGLDTIDPSEITKESIPNQDPRRLKFSYFGATQELESQREPSQKHQMLTGKNEENGGVDTMDTQRLSWTTSMGAFPGALCSESPIGTRVPYKQKDHQCNLSQKRSISHQTPTQETGIPICQKSQELDFWKESQEFFTTEEGLNLAYARTQQ